MPKIKLLRMMQDKAQRLGCNKEDLITVGLEMVCRLPEEQLATTISYNNYRCSTNFERSLN